MIGRQLLFFQGGARHLDNSLQYREHTYWMTRVNLTTEKEQGFPFRNCEFLSQFIFNLLQLCEIKNIIIFFLIALLHTIQQDEHTTRNQALFWRVKVRIICQNSVQNIISNPAILLCTICYIL